MTNRLAGETSPYLRQHQDNPVHWWPWGEAALAEAKASNRPLLLSIGYSACHWCHVMAHESFENAEIAALMNTLFVNVKIDREERPDLDAIYQQALSHMGQHGGWPLTMFCTPDGKPFWGGTYFPPTARYGRPGFAEVLQAIHDLWQSDGDRVRNNVEALLLALAEPKRGQAPILSPAMLDQGAKAILAAIDMEQGGLSGAPKFPQPGLFDYLWRSALRTGDQTLHRAVTLTLDRICQGGITDHLGGGFMRYSTDDIWLAPHFEKMLYDNAQLIDLLTLVWQDTGNGLFKTRIEECIAWVSREMLAEDGAFAAALDADSEGHEGKFYTWNAQDIVTLLGAELAKIFGQAYDVSLQGNWEGVNILNRSGPQPEGVEDQLAQGRALLLAQRDTRIRPGRDDKVLADWNGMMIAALANAGFVFDRPDWLAMAERAFAVITGKMALADDRLAHCLCQGRAGAVGFIDDLAHMARAALMLYQTTGATAYLDQAEKWVAAADCHHWDQNLGGYFHVSHAATDVIVRTKPVIDAAVPSANGTMVQVLAILAQITDKPAYADRAQATVAVFMDQFNEHFANMSALLTGFDLAAAPVLITLPRGHVDLLQPVRQTGIANRIIRWSDDGVASVCRDSVCSAPVTSAPALRHLLTGE
ncbi:thioredoxin domain-containing protein [Magnetospirillum sulfuroxidans]|uniref:Thioredoxin domain-containing protein n=1 Tax=Magnetospirillum sulfuroxidans TaxID=611300 RepID=A0ABS5IGS1_9PROT|nr:thioredoxin domain-containing protein [Magnetospirillum sulfuroxidans]MBR9973633.1 thioredoxin domain-containing protein [Magnetospirillum sulfuroxidans]